MLIQHFKYFVSSLPQLSFSFSSFTITDGKIRKEGEVGRRLVNPEALPQMGRCGQLSSLHSLGFG